jgi:hypothetical protein
MLEVNATQSDQILVQGGTAKEFLETDDLAAQLVARIPTSANTPF